MKILSALFGGLTAAATPPLVPPVLPPQARPAVRATGGVRVQAAATQQHRTIQNGPFEALWTSPDRTPIPASGLALQRFLPSDRWGALSERLRRESLAALARHIGDNFPMAGYALDLTANYSAPVIPRSATDDPDWNRETDDDFDEWAETADWQGRFDYATMQRLACFAIDTDGDLGASMQYDELDVPKLRMWPCWRIGRQDFGTKADAREIDGVIFDAQERVTGYRILQTTPDIYTTYSTADFILLYEPNRLERFRGLSALRAGMNDLRDAHDVKSFAKLREKISQAIAAVIQGGAPMPEDWEGEQGESAAANRPAEMPRSLALASLLGGDIPVIDGELKQVTPPPGGANALEFTETLIGHFIAGLGYPPAFFLDAKNTGPGWRAVIGKAQKVFDRRKAVLKRLSRWVRTRYVAHRIATGRIRPIAGWDRVRFQTPPLLIIDLGDAAKSDREAVKSGLKSRARLYGAASEEWQDETEQIIAEDDFIIGRLKEQAARTGVPLDTLLTRHGYEVVKAEKPQAGEGGAPAGASQASAGGVETSASAEPMAYRRDQRRHKGKFADEGRGSKGKDMDKAERAKASHKPSTVEKQRRAEAEQRKFAAAVGGANDGDNLAFDVRRGRHAIEFKCVMDNANDKITMHSPSRRRKEAFAKKNRLVAHTVVKDIRGSSPVYYYRQGVGAFRLGSMEKVTLADLKERLK